MLETTYATKKWVPGSKNFQKKLRGEKKGKKKGKRKILIKKKKGKKVTGSWEKSTGSLPHLSC